MTLAAAPPRKKRQAVPGRKKRHAAPAKPRAADLLRWYDRHRRKLPWRAENGEKPDPYRVWLSEIMLQQTTVKAVAPYYARFLARWPRLQDLASVRLEEVLKLWAGLGYYARARHLHACARMILGRHGGIFPDTEDELRRLPGIGAYTAAAIAAIAFDRKATPVDGNIERVVARLFAVEEPLPAAKEKIRALARTLTPSGRTGDFAQAMMDLGATICTQRPACALCPWNKACGGHARGDQETFPRKAPKAEGKLRRGAAFILLRDDGALLLRTRPEKGLLGGMTEVPTTEWTQDFDERDAVAQAAGIFLSPGRRRAGPCHKDKPENNESLVWQRVPGVVTHTFTHFPLELVVYRAKLARPAAMGVGTRWVDIRAAEKEALPSVMRKVIAHALHGNPVRSLPARGRRTKLAG